MKKFFLKYLNISTFLLDAFIIDTPYKAKHKLDLISKEMDDLIKDDFNRKFNSKSFYMDDKICDDAHKRIKEIDLEVKRLGKIVKEFKFEIDYAYYSSLFTILIYELMMFFICYNYIGIESPLSLIIIFLNFFIIPLIVYKYWVIQTDKYYGKLI